MSLTTEVSCRVDYRSMSASKLDKQSSHLDSFSPTGCMIRIRHIPETDALELRIYLPSGDWPPASRPREGDVGAMGWVHAAVRERRVSGKSNSASEEAEVWDD
jgi:hypothetical protein